MKTLVVESDRSCVCDWTLTVCRSLPAAARHGRVAPIGPTVTNLTRRLRSRQPGCVRCEDEPHEDEERPLVPGHGLLGGLRLEPRWLCGHFGIGGSWPGSGRNGGRAR